MPKVIDLTGKEFGLWKVLRRATKEETPANASKAFWWCQCQCENKTERAVNSQSLTRGLSTNCGCNRIGNALDETDNVYGKLKVIRRANKKEVKELGYNALIDEGRAQWLCECECGNKVVRPGHTLRAGLLSSCGSCNEVARIGEEFGLWKVIRKASAEEIRDNKAVKNIYGYRLCECKCGNVRYVATNNLIQNISTNCGCIKKERDTIDETGNVHNNWLVLREATEEEIRNEIGDKDTHNAWWWCMCKCGTERAVMGHSLRNGQSIGCGCSVGKTRRLDDNRTQEQIELIENKDRLENALIEFIKINNRKPDSTEVMNMLGYNMTSSALWFIRSRGLEQYVEVRQPGKSGLERRVAKELQLEDGTYIINNRNILHGKEIDIYIPSIRLGIEINGDYWHSDAYKDKMFHYNKSIEATKKGIRLLQIYEHEWNDLRIRRILKELIYGLIHGSKRVYARQCSLRQLRVNEEFEFNNRYHIQGAIGSTVAYGLFYNNELMCMMSFGSPRFDKDCVWELIRYTVRADVHVIGGAERLLHHFRSTHAGNIVSYCHISKFTGKIYKQLGFKLVSISEPSYVWTKGGNNEVLSRFQCQKHKLLQKGWGTEEETETQIMEKHGYYKLYDCGNYKFVLN